MKLEMAGTRLERPGKRPATLLSRLAARASLTLLPVVIFVFVFMGGADAALGQAPGIQVVGATSSNPLGLTHGCNAVIISSPNGTPLTAIAALVSPASAVVSIWRYNNASNGFQVGYFSDPRAPVTFSTTGTGITGTSTETYYICVNQAATIVSI
jgi:hypothetical protein